MQKNRSLVERRSHERFQTRENTYAVLHLPANTIGQLIDIGSAGLSFKYFSSQDRFIESSGLDLYTEQGLCLERIPFEIVDDFLEQRPYARTQKIDRPQVGQRVEVRIPAVLENDYALSHISSLRQILQNAQPA